MQHITLCMIVRDEAASLAAVFESARGAFDEAVVVDTGSQDHTPELARTLGARVVRFSWCDDFSQARNVGLDLVHTGWVLVLDADERLSVGAAQTIREATRQDGGGWFLRRLEVVDGAELPEHFWLMRLWRADPKIRYRGRLHESVVESVASVWGAAALHRLDATFVHHGYSSAERARKGTYARNTRILERERVERPTDPYVIFNIAQEQFATGSWESARGSYQDAIHLVARGQPTYLGFAYARLSDCHRRLRQPDLSRATLADAVARCPADATLGLLYGISLQEAGEHRAALPILERCLTLPEAPLFGGFSMRGASGDRALLHLADSEFVLGRHTRSQNHLVIALPGAEGREVARLWAQHALDYRTPGEVLAEWRRISPGTPLVTRAMVEVLIGRGEERLALQELDRVGLDDSVLRGLCLAGLGDFARSHALLTSVAARSGEAQGWADAVGFLWQRRAPAQPTHPVSLLARRWAEGVAMPPSDLLRGAWAWAYRWSLRLAPAVHQPVRASGAELFPEVLSRLGQQAWALVFAREWTMALALLERMQAAVTERAPAVEADIRFLLARVHHGLGAHSQAIQTAHAALTFSPNTCWERYLWTANIAREQHDRATLVQLEALADQSFPDHDPLGV